MEMAWLITQQIISMFIMIGVGILLKKANILPKEAGTYLSRIALKVLLPCTIINAFQIEYKEEVKNGLILAFTAAFFFNMILIVLPRLLKKWLRLSVMEQASLSYPNSGEILIPLVVSALSKEQQVYCCAFLIVQLLFIFTHGEMLISGQSMLHIKGLLSNVNVIAIGVAFLLFLFKIQLPDVVVKVTDSFSEMLAPACMLAIGISVGTCDLKQIFGNKRIYLICFLRLVLMPLIILSVIKVSGAVNIMEDAKEIILVVFMATASSVSATVTNMAYSYQKEEQKASAINVMSVLLLALTLPVMVLLYQAGF